MKLLPATKVALKFAAACALAYGGWRGYTAYRLAGIQVEPIAPDVVSLVAVAADSGHRIIVANQVAQLVETAGEFQAAGSGDAGYESGIKRRVPIREMLKALAGDSESLGKFLFVMTGQKEDDLPPVRKVWKAADVESAIEGDSKLAEQLEKDLNVKLDGTPLSNFTLEAIENGIVLEIPVQVQLKGRNYQTTISRPFRPAFAKSVSDKISEASADIQLRQVAALYKQQYEKTMADPKGRQDLRNDLREAVKASDLKSRFAAPTRLLESTVVIVNSTHITSAAYEKSTASTSRAPLFDMRLQLTPQGRDRLWKYSHEHPGFQLLFVVDGIAIAAPRIGHDMWQSEVLVNQLPDEVLVRDAVDTINQQAKQGKSPT